MLERLDIEQGTRDSMELVWDYELAIYVVQAEAVLRVLRGENSFRLSTEAKAKIKRLARQSQRYTRESLEREITKLVKADMAAQLSRYERAFKAGVVKSVPKIPLAVKFANAVAISAVADFVTSTIERVAESAGDSLEAILQKAIEDKLRGETTHAVATAASKRIREQGIQIRQPSGRRVRDIYAYVRQALVSAVNLNSAEQQMALFDSIDMPDDKKGFATSSHWGARPEHALWQGKIFANKEEFIRETAYGEITGICGINCRHSFYPFIHGLDTQTFFPKDEEENERRYRAQQKRRRMESQIRLLVAEDEILKAMGQPPKNTGRIKGLRSRLRAHNADQQERARAYAEAS